jgi:hypothetical protein
VFLAAGCDLDDSRPGISTTRLSNFAAYKSEEKLRRNTRDLFNHLEIEPLTELIAPHGAGVWADLSPLKDAHFAFTLDSERKLCVFLAWNGRLRLWTGKAPKVPPRKIAWDNKDPRDGKWATPKPTFEIPTDIRDRFFAYQDKVNWYFVTESGEIHVLPREGKPRRTKRVWEDLDRPVRMLVEDNATGKTWAFAPRKDRSDKEPPDVYFPLAKKMEPVEYDSTKLPAWDLGKPLALALAHARFLVKEKKVTLDEKKPKPADKK